MDRVEIKPNVVLNAWGELLDNGTIQWKEDKRSQMFTRSNFENEECLPCRLLPLCIGPCFQKRMEYEQGKMKKRCFMERRETGIVPFIIDYYEEVKAKNFVKIKP